MLFYDSLRASVGLAIENSLFKVFAIGMLFRKTVQTQTVVNHRRFRVKRIAALVSLILYRLNTYIVDLLQRPEAAHRRFFFRSGDSRIGVMDRQLTYVMQKDPRLPNASKSRPDNFSGLVCPWISDNRESAETMK